MAPHLLIFLVAPSCSRTTNRFGQFRLCRFGLGLFRNLLLAFVEVEEGG
jgi:hypothetical protein